MEKPSKKVGNITELRRTELLMRVMSGETIASISRDTGCNQTHLYRIFDQSRDLIASAIDEAHARLRARLPELTDLALTTLENQMRNGGPDTKRKAASALLSVSARLMQNRCDHCDHIRVVDHQ